MTSHRFDIHYYNDEGYATNVAFHFNSDSHSVTNDFRFLPMDIVSDEMKSLCKLHKLDMLHSNGRNAKILYTLK